MRGHHLGHIATELLREGTYGGVATCDCGQVFKATASSKRGAERTIMRRHRHHRDTVTFRPARRLSLPS
jgi:hypothetical protein